MSLRCPRRAGLALLLLAGALLAACGGEGADTGVPLVEDPWIREAPPGSRVLAGYMTLHNAGERTLVLTGASGGDFERIELHATQMHGDHMRMEHLHRIELAPGERTELAPGGLHLMLMGPNRTLAAGDTVDLTLDFGDDLRLPVRFEVRDTRSRAP